MLPPRYVVGQYPRFLRAHWKFLKTVVLKLFEFMHEKHPGVQDMACDTFLKVAQKLKRKFVMLQAGESCSFVEELCDMLPATIVDLEIHQIHTFYEAAGHMVSAHPDPTARGILLERVMALPNQLWRRVMNLAAANLEELKKPEIVKEVQRILRTNVRICKSVGPSFIKQMGNMYLDMLNVYKAYSEYISHRVTTEGPRCMDFSDIRLMMVAKRETLALIKVFVQKADDVNVRLPSCYAPASRRERVARWLTRRCAWLVGCPYTRSSPRASSLRCSRRCWATTSATSPRRVRPRYCL